MSLPHFFAGAPEPGSPLRLEGDDARHAVGALRMRVGERLTSGDGEGAVATCVVERMGRNELLARVEERRVLSRPEPHVSVYLSPPKGERLTWAVQKLTELGVDSLILVESGRSVRRWWGEERGQRAAARVRRVARESARQSRRAFLPALGGPIPWDSVVNAVTTQGLLVVLWERAQTGLLPALPKEPPGLVGLLVGPEGGIPEDDAREAEARGARLASLGPTILRTETAAVAAAAVALAAYGRLG